MQSTFCPGLSSVSSFARCGRHNVRQPLSEGSSSVPFAANSCELKKQEAVGKWKNPYPSHRKNSISSTGQRHKISHGNVIHKISSGKDLEQEQRDGRPQLFWNYSEASSAPWSSAPSSRSMSSSLMFRKGYTRPAGDDVGSAQVAA